MSIAEVATAFMRGLACLPNSYLLSVLTFDALRQIKLFREILDRELKTEDDYNLSDEHNGKRYALYKTQYPHHEGIWSWGKQANQVVLLLQNPRTALVSYQHLLHEIDYGTEW